MSYRIAAGALVAALSLTPSLVHATGGPDPDFGTGGVVDVALLDEVGPVTVDSSGRTVVVGTYNGKIAFARYRTDGTPDPSFSSDGRSEVDLTVGRFGAVDIRVLADGSIVSGGERTSDPGDVFSNGLWAAKVTANGAPAPGYGTNGVASEPQGFVVYGGRGSIAADGSMVIVQVASGSGNTYSPVSASGTFGAGGGLEIDTAVLPPGCIAYRRRRATDPVRCRRRLVLGVRPRRPDRNRRLFHRLGVHTDPPERRRIGGLVAVHPCARGQPGRRRERPRSDR